MTLTNKFIGAILLGSCLLLGTAAHALSPSEAASIAQRQHGGKVLAVNASGGNPPNYRVRLLLSGGKIITVTVRGK